MIDNSTANLVLTYKVKPIVLLPLLFIMLGCSPASPTLESLNIYELADQAFKCDDNDNPAPGAAISCENIRRECARRSASRGYKSC